MPYPIRSSPIESRIAKFRYRGLPWSCTGKKVKRIR